ncbi:MAG: hypothetical protein BGO89_06150 [Candidatus Kapaibacterium thiocyanatum]|uniref:Uncharacterized protein n=1 Tax=Candidatus Kapaibacterium thiocyanatum TaxID=1895771 RepID=A0A1M3KZG1_9BACT|nr:MAG: hypothetical protein BGO89_06150 ['Candidatus Kapabacteria' thiocyanatum]
MKAPHDSTMNINIWRTLLSASVGLAFVLLAWYIDSMQASMLYVSANAVAMALLFGGVLHCENADAWYHVFPVFEAVVITLLLRRTRSTAVWVVTIVLAILVLIPVLFVTKLG